MTVGQPLPSDDQFEEGYREQAGLLANAGADLLLLEMMDDIKYTRIALKAAVDTGLPTWVGFSCELPGDRSAVMLLKNEETLGSGIEAVIPLGGSMVAVMHTLTEDIEPALRVIKESWEGPVGAYAHSGVGEPLISSRDYLTQALRWVEMGTQVVGTCCRMGPEYIRLLREELPGRIPRP